MSNIYFFIKKILIYKKKFHNTSNIYFFKENIRDMNNN